MIEAIKNQQIKQSKTNQFWGDELFQTYYSTHFDNLTSKQLDVEFSKDLRVLVKALSKLPENERKAFIDTISHMIEFYIEHKVEKELDFSFSKILSF